jgi:CMP/dCMP kinase
VVAIDGPAGAGKSTLAAAVAQRLGLERLDTGAMYRAVTWAALDRGIALADRQAVAELSRKLVIDLGDGVRVDGVDATDAIRSEAVDAAVSEVAANREVRAELVARQRAWEAEREGAVVEGRDIGTVVLPDADVKVYLTAATDERAKRRAAERGDGRSAEQVAGALRRRDLRDSTRGASPLPAPDDVADDAVVIDSTRQSPEAVLHAVLELL